MAKRKPKKSPPSPKGEVDPKSVRNKPISIPLDFELAVEALVNVRPKKKDDGSAEKK